MVPFLFALMACGTSTPVVPPPPASVVPPTPPHAAIALDQARADATFELPPTTRPGGAPAPETFGPVAPFTRVRTGDGVTVWTTPLPMGSDLFPSRKVGARTFGNFAPAGLEITLDGAKLPFHRDGKRPGTWGYDRTQLFLGLPPDQPGPTPQRVRITWPRATQAEDALHPATSGLSADAFALRTLTVDTGTTTGVLLPAPARATWSVHVPAGAVFVTRARVLPPAIRAPEGSDGFELRVVVDDAVVSTTEVGPEAPVDVRADLSAFADKTVRLSLQTSPGATADLDLAFLEDPTIYVPSDEPKRVVVAFIDTVRRDHLGMYGYARDTSPKLDAWAAGGVRLDDHRTVAPWTLPSARAALSGHQPEAWFDVPSLAQRLGEAGFHTEGIVANAYLSQAFEMHRGFDAYRFEILQPAAKTVDQALETLARWPDRDLFLYVQFMEAHLPYQEPRAYQGLYAGSKPDSLPGVTRVELVKRRPGQPDFEAVKTYVTDRYDQNIRVLDDEVTRLFAAVGADAVTVLFADHGEELWDHDGFEHGHSFYDELLKVPMVVRSPALRPGVLDAPTSLLDLTPTVLDLVGLPVDDDAPGRPLRAAANGDAAAREALRARPQAVGRPLYGDDGWGVVAEGRKWIDRSGVATAWDLKADPQETRDIAGALDPSEMAGRTAAGLGRDVVRVWRVVSNRRAERAPVTLEITHPEGIEAAWKAYDPRGFHEDVVLEVTDGVLRVKLPRGSSLPEAIYVQPRGDAGKPQGLALEIGGAAKGRFEVSEAPVALDGRTVVLDKQGLWQLEVDLAWVPVPSGTEVSGYEDEMAEELKELGYLEE